MVAKVEESLVSVIIPTYNYARFLGRTLQSVLSQSYPSLELLVINDGSTDDTVDVIQQFAEDRRLRSYTQSNQGAIKAMNKGIELSTGDHVAFCGSDDLWNRNHLKLLMEAMTRHPDAGMVFDNAEYFDDSLDSQARQFVVPGEKGKNLDGKPVSLQDIFTYNWVTNCNFIVRREVLDRLGCFDPLIYMTGDLHLIYRVAAYYPIYYVDYIGVRVRIHGQNMSVLKPHYEYGVRCLEDIRENHPDVLAKIGSRVFLRKLGRKYFRLARYYERVGDLEKARWAYKKAFLTRKTRPRYYWSYLRLGCRQVIDAVSAPRV